MSLSKYNYFTSCYLLVTVIYAVRNCKDHPCSNNVYSIITVKALPVLQRITHGLLTSITNLTNQILFYIGKDTYSGRT